VGRDASVRCERSIFANGSGCRLCLMKRFASLAGFADGGETRIVPYRFRGTTIQILRVYHRLAPTDFDQPTCNQKRFFPERVSLLEPAVVGSVHFLDFSFSGLRSRTPGPPPFSSMNSTPAASKARRTARSFTVVIEVSSFVSSARRIVATLNDVCRARSSALHRIRDRAALICALLSGFEPILTSFKSYAIFHSISNFYSL